MISNVQVRFPAPGWRNRLDLFFAGLGLGINPGTVPRARIARVAELEGLSDAELARKGLARNDIAAHVFSDLFSTQSP